MSAASTTSRVHPSGVNSNSFSAAGAYPMNSRVASNQTNSFGKVTDGFKSINGGQTNKFASNVGVTSNSVLVRHRHNCSRFVVLKLQAVLQMGELRLIITR